MKKNLVTAARRPVVATQYRPGGRGSEVIVASNGEVNASSKADLLQQNMRLVQAAAEGRVVTESEARQRETASRVNRELLTAAFRDKDAHRILGEKMANEIYMTSNRKGFLRRFMNRMELKQGDLPRFPVRMKNVQAAVMTGRNRMETQFVQDKYLMPPEFSIGARIFIHQTDINQSNTDILEEKYVEALEAIMVAEDRMWLRMNQALIGVDNNRQVISGTLSPQALMNVRLGVTKWGLKAPYCLLAADLFTDIVGDPSFIQAIDPVARHELVMTGELATLYGLSLITEAYRHPEHKVLNEGELVVVSDSLTHGAYSDRNGVDSAPLDITTERVPGRGWSLNESFAAAVGNSRSASFGIRI